MNEPPASRRATDHRSTERARRKAHVLVHESRNERRSDGETEVTRFEDDPARPNALAMWLPIRDAWTRNEARAIEAMNPSIDLKPGDLRRTLLDHCAEHFGRSLALKRAGEETESVFEREVPRGADPDAWRESFIPGQFAPGVRRNRVKSASQDS